MSKVKIYHNPRCSKSRATLALLEEKGIKADIILYLDQPPSPETLAEILDQLGMKLVGADPAQVEVLWERMARGGGVFSGQKLNRMRRNTQ